MFGKRGKSATGIHFAGRRLRIVELAHSRAGVILRRAAQEELDRPFAPVELTVPKLRRELAEVLQQIGERRDLSFDRPCVAIDPRLVLLKRRPLIAPGAQTRRARRANWEHLEWEMQQLLGDERPQFCVDYVLFSEWGYVVAVRRDLLGLYLELFAAAGISDLDFDLESFSLCNAAEEVGALTGKGREVLVATAEEGVQALLFEGGELEGMTHCEGEKDSRDLSAARVEDCLRRLAEECGREKVQQVWVAGEGVEKVVEELAGRVEGECTVFDPFADLEESDFAALHPELMAEAPAFAIATGLAYRRLKK